MSTILPGPGSRGGKTAKCPSWCDQPNCHGDHSSGPMGSPPLPESFGGYVPATGGLPSVDPERGTSFPAVAASCSWDTIDGLDPCVSIHVAMLDGDAGFDLRPHEAHALIAQLQRTLEALEQG